jgi:nitroreductase
MDFSEFQRFLEGRSSVRDFNDQPLTEVEISRILACASSAPSAGNREAWDVVVVTDPQIRKELERAALEQPHVGSAPVLFVICSNYIRSMSRYGERGILYAVQDATIACTYMMLAAQVSSIASCWTGAFEEEEVRAILDLPQHIRPVAILAAGRAGSHIDGRTGRMPINEHVHRERWA